MMSNDRLRKGIERYIPLSNTEWKVIEPLFRPKVVPKNSYLIRPGQVCHELCFVLKGGFRVYNLNEQGQEVVSWLPFEDCFLCEFVSFYSNSPTPEYIQAIEDAELLVISRQHIKQLYQQLPQWERFGRLLAEETLIDVKHYVLSLIRETAEERYKRLLEEFPQLIQRVPLKYIASYIGVTDSSLSRIRRSFTD